jgi:hypothetical protein
MYEGGRGQSGAGETSEGEKSLRQALEKEELEFLLTQRGEEICLLASVRQEKRVHLLTEEGQVPSDYPLVGRGEQDDAWLSVEKWKKVPRPIAKAFA